MMRIAVTGSMGQGGDLVDRAGVARVRDRLAWSRVFLLEDRAIVLAGLKAARPDLVINAAAYTAVDQAEAERRTSPSPSTARGQAMWRKPPTGSARPLLQLSTDYVFDGAAQSPLPRGRSARGREAPTGARTARRKAGRRALRQQRDRAHRLALQPVRGANFVRTMLSLNEMRDEVSVVADQRGNPTSALDLATALLAVAARVREEASPALFGVFHMTGSGEATWADFAEAIFAEAAARGRRLMRVKRITTADYPTPAPRPANSRLDNEKLRRVYGLRTARLAEFACGLLRAASSDDLRSRGKRPRRRNRRRIAPVQHGPQGDRYYGRALKFISSFAMGFGGNA